MWSGAHVTLLCQPGWEGELSIGRQQIGHLWPPKECGDGRRQANVFSLSVCVSTGETMGLKCPCVW